MAGFAALAACAADEVVLGSRLPAPAELRDGLFPDEACDELKEKGFKCMGFKPAARYALPAAAFRPGSAELPPGVRQQLDRFAEVLGTGTHPAEHRIRVEGHADASGDATRNVALSVRRAEAACHYLVSKGVPAETLVAVGRGSEDLADTEHPFAARNRRIVIGRDAPPAAEVAPAP